MSKLLIETNEGVRTIIFNRPETKNAFDAELWSLFRDALNSASDDPDISSVIVTEEILLQKKQPTYQIFVTKLPCWFVKIL
mgnify:CR=1 FL=1